MNFKLPSKEELKFWVERFRNKEEHKGLSSYFSSRDEYDQTNVYDFIDDRWYELMEKNMQMVFLNSWHDGDGSFEHRLAVVAMDIILKHDLENGNKRSATLVLVLLSSFNHQTYDMTTEEWDELIVEITASGNDNRDESIKRLRDVLKETKIPV